MAENTVHAGKYCSWRFSAENTVHGRRFSVALGGSRGGSRLLQYSVLQYSDTDQLVLGEIRTTSINDLGVLDQFSAAARLTRTGSRQRPCFSARTQIASRHPRRFSAFPGPATSFLGNPRQRPAFLGHTSDTTRSIPDRDQFSRHTSALPRSTPLDPIRL